MIFWVRPFTSVPFLLAMQQKKSRANKTKARDGSSRETSYKKVFYLRSAIAKWRHTQWSVLVAAGAAQVTLLWNILTQNNPAISKTLSISEEFSSIAPAILKWRRARGSNHVGRQELSMLIMAAKFYSSKQSRSAWIFKTISNPVDSNGNCPSIARPLIKWRRARRSYSFREACNARSRNAQMANWSSFRATIQWKPKTKAAKLNGPISNYHYT